MSIGSTNLASQFSKSSDTTIQWTELLVARDPPSASAAFFAIFLLSFAHIASLLASLLYSVADKAPLSSAVVRFGVILLSAQQLSFHCQDPIETFRHSKVIGLHLPIKILQGKVLKLQI